jgi:hypothetical protein
VEPALRLSQNLLSCRCVAIKSGQQEAEKAEVVEDLLEALDAALDRVKVHYEQYFLGIQKQPPTYLHTDVERKIRDLTQLQIRNTALRYRFVTLQQKFGSYNSYWRRTLRQIESGTYLRNLSKIGQAARTGAAVPEEILAAMPKRMREQIKRDREAALALAELRRRPVDEPEFLTLAEEEPGAGDLDPPAFIDESTELRRHVRSLGGAPRIADAADAADFDVDAFFAAVTSEGEPAPLAVAPPAGVAVPAGPPVAALAAPPAAAPAGPPVAALAAPPAAAPAGPPVAALATSPGAALAGPPVAALAAPPVAALAAPPAAAPAAPLAALVASPVAALAAPPLAAPVAPPVAAPPVVAPVAAPGALSVAVRMMIPPRVATPPVDIIATRAAPPGPSSPPSPPRMATPPTGTQATRVASPGPESPPSQEVNPPPVKPSPAPSQATRSIPVLPGAAAARAPAAVETLAGPFPRLPSLPPLPSTLRSPGGVLPAEGARAASPQPVSPARAADLAAPLRSSPGPSAGSSPGASPGTSASPSAGSSPGPASDQSPPPVPLPAALILRAKPKP